MPRLTNVSTTKFLQEHQDFSWRVRLIAAKKAYESLNASSDTVVRGAFMIQIIEELFAQTEDFLMWLAAVRNKEHLPKNVRDVWEYLLVCRASDPAIKNVLVELARFKTARGLLRRMDLPTPRQVGVIWEEEESVVSKRVEGVLIKAIVATRQTRFGRRGGVLRFHAKLKHGMVVLRDGDRLFIRDLRLPNAKKREKKRRNRNFDVEVSEKAAKRLLDTLEGTAFATKLLSQLLYADYAHNALHKKGRRSKLERTLKVIVERRLRGDG